MLCIREGGCDCGLVGAEQSLFLDYLILQLRKSKIVNH